MRSLPGPHPSRTQACSKKWWTMRELMNKHSIRLRYHSTYGTCPVYRNGGLKSNSWKHNKRSVTEPKKNGLQGKETLFSSYLAHPRILTVQHCQAQGQKQALAGRFDWGEIWCFLRDSQSLNFSSSQICQLWPLSSADTLRPYTSNDEAKLLWI